METAAIILYVVLAVVVGSILIYTAFRMAGAGWYRSQYHHQLRTRQEKRDAK